MSKFGVKKGLKSNINSASYSDGQVYFVYDNDDLSIYADIDNTRRKLESPVSDINTLYSNVSELRNDLNSTESAYALAEQSRVSAEQARVSAETSRSNAETSRVNAETTRATEWTSIKNDAISATSAANTAATSANTAVTDLRAAVTRGDFNGTNAYATVTKSGSTATITVTDANGTTTTTVNDGATGVAGADGYSPTVSVQSITGGHEITITDTQGTHSFNVLDGSDAQAGLFMAIYGTSTYNEVLEAFDANKIVYCLVAGSSTNTYRLAFLAYKSNTNFEFQYYRSMNPSNLSETIQGDEVYVYTLKNDNTWTTAVRKAYTQIAAGIGLNGTYNNGVYTLTNTAIYTLPAATTNILGGVKIGTGLAIDENGVLSLNVPVASGVSF